GASSQASGQRWGDYTDMVVDPVDDCTFWYTNEYVVGGNWRMRIGAFKFPTCTTGPTPTATATFTGTPSPTPTATSTATFTPTPLCTPNYSSTTSTGNTVVPGTTLVTGSNCDDCSNPVALPFPFTFYGMNFNSVNAISNGNLQFSTATTTFTNTCLPESTLDGLIAPHWDDL